MIPLRTLLATKNKALFVTAHPDDSAVMLGGTIQLAVELFGNDHVFAVIATNGEAGENHLPAGNEEFVKKGHRQEEEQAALTFLGMEQQNISFAELPDGGISQKANIEQLATALKALCQKHEIDLIITLGAHNDGHPDHIATHQAALRASQQLKNIAVLALNGDHSGEYSLELTPETSSKKFTAAALHVSQYNIPGWLIKKGANYSMGPKFAQASAFYPPLAMRETFDTVKNSEIL